MSPTGTLTMVFLPSSLRVTVVSFFAASGVKPPASVIASTTLIDGV